MTRLGLTARATLSCLVATGCVVLAVIPAAARTSPKVTALSASSLTLTAENPAIVRAGGTLKLGVQIHSPDNPADLGFQILVYHGVSNYDDFYTPPSGEAAYVLPATGAVPLSAVSSGSSTQSQTLSIAISSGSSSSSKVAAPAAGTVPLVLTGCQPCDGVYPIQVVLVNRAEGDVELAELTTHLIYVTQASAMPLRVGIVLPVGATPALTANHTALLSARELADVGELIGAVNSHPGDRVSLDLYPQLEVGLGAARNSHLAQARLASLTGLVRRGVTHGTLELLRTPFIPLSVSALASAGLKSELNRQFERSSNALANNASESDAGAPYVATDALTTGALSLLDAQHINEIVLPSRDVNTAGNFVQTAPFALLPSASAPAKGAPEALAADPTLARYLEDPGSAPVLAAHELLAALAAIFFGTPFGSSPRGVAITPASLPSNPATLKTLLNTLLGGLSADPILTTATIGGLFSGVPVGADNAGGALYNATTGVLAPGGRWTPIPGEQIQRARRALSIYTTIAKGDTGHESRLNDTILLAEGATLTAGQRSRLTDAVAAVIPDLSRSLSVSSSHTITLTARSGEFPITIKMASAPPAGGLSLLLRLSSGQDALSFPHTKNHSLAVQIDTLDSAQNIEVSSRTSGASALTLELVSPPSPAGQVVLLRRTDFSVRSTAISGVAVGLTLGAALVLLAWWFRSIVRQRRGGRRARRGRAEVSLEVAPRD